MRWWHWFLIGVVLFVVDTNFPKAMPTLPDENHSVLPLMSFTAFLVPMIAWGIEKETRKRFSTTLQVAAWLTITVVLVAYPYLF